MAALLNRIILNKENSEASCWTPCKHTVPSPQRNCRASFCADGEAFEHWAHKKSMKRQPLLSSDWHVSTAMQRHVVCQRSRAGQWTGTEVTGSKGSLALGVQPAQPGIKLTAESPCYSTHLHHICSIGFPRGHRGAFIKGFRWLRLQARRSIQEKRSTDVRFSLTKIGYTVIDSCTSVRTPDWRADRASHRRGRRPTYNSYIFEQQKYSSRPIWSTLSMAPAGA